MRILIMGILKFYCASNKQVFLKTVLKLKKIKAGGYIASERICLFFMVRFVYLFKT